MSSTVKFVGRKYFMRDLKSENSLHFLATTWITFQRNENFCENLGKSFTKVGKFTFEGWSI